MFINLKFVYIYHRAYSVQVGSVGSIFLCIFL